MLLVSVIQASISGFFQEAFGIAGVAVGYVVAAWQYQRLAGYFAAYVSSRWLAEIVAFLAIFCLVMVLAGILGGENGSLAGERSWTSRHRPVHGRLVRSGARVFADCHCSGEYDGIYTQLALAGRIWVGAVFSGGGTGRNLGRTRGFAGAVLPGA